MIFAFGVYCFTEAEGSHRYGSTLGTTFASMFPVSDLVCTHCGDSQILYRIKSSAWWLTVFWKTLIIIRVRTDRARALV